MSFKEEIKERIKEILEIKRTRTNDEIILEQCYKFLIFEFSEADVLNALNEYGKDVIVLIPRKQKNSEHILEFSMALKSILREKQNDYYCPQRLRFEGKQVQRKITFLELI